MGGSRLQPWALLRVSRGGRSLGLGAGRTGARPLIVLQEFLDPVGDVLLRLLQLLLQPLPFCIEVALVRTQALVQPGLLLWQDTWRS